MTVNEFVALKKTLNQASDDDLRRFLRDTCGDAIGALPSTPEGWQACFLAWQYARRGRVVMVEALMLTDAPSTKYVEHLTRRLKQSGVPERLHDGLVHYIGSRRPVGHFLTAVLSNDLAEACSRGDDVCQRALYELVFFLYNYAPRPCWGSPEAVQAWLTDERAPAELYE